MPEYSKELRDRIDARYLKTTKNRLSAARAMAALRASRAAAKAEAPRVRQSWGSNDKTEGTTLPAQHDASAIKL